MKKILILCFLALSITFSQAQKFGYVDSQKILEQVPDYKKAQKEIDRLSVEYQKQIESEYQVLDSMYRSFKEEQILLTEEMKEKRSKAISEKEKEIKDFQKKVFGYEGLVFLKRQELISPIQDKVHEAIEKIAKVHKLQFVFDKSGDLSIIYVNPTHDYTDYVLEELELKKPDDGKTD